MEVGEGVDVGVGEDLGEVIPDGQDRFDVGAGAVFGVQAVAEIAGYGGDAAAGKSGEEMAGDLVGADGVFEEGRLGGEVEKKGLLEGLIMGEPALLWDLF